MSSSSWRTFSVKVGSWTPRERAAVALLAFCASLATVAWSQDWALQSEQSAQNTRLERQQAEFDLAQAKDISLRKDIDDAVSKMRAMSIVEPSLGMAQADFLSNVERLAKQSGLANMRISLPPPDDVSDASLQVLSANVTADFNWKTLSAMLEALDASPLGFRVEAIERRSRGDQPSSVTLMLRAPFLKAAGQS